MTCQKVLVVSWRDSDFIFLSEHLHEHALLTLTGSSLARLLLREGVELRIASVQPLPAEAGGEVFAKTSQQNSLCHLNVALGFCLRRAQADTSTQDTAQAAISTPALLQQCSFFPTTALLSHHPTHHHSAAL